MQAMILAAGLGTRLLPHTMVRPKPLFPVLNQPLLLLTIRRLQRLGFDLIVVNCHHLRQQIVAALKGIAGVVVQEEEVILGTGGGLRRALVHLREEPLFVTNGDLYHTVDIPAFYDHHRSSGNHVTLALHDYPRFNTVQVNNGRVTSFDTRGEADLLAFTGLHVLDPTLLEGIGVDEFSCIIDLYRRMLLDGGRIATYRVDDCFWTDMGTPADYLGLHQGLLTGTIPCWPEADPVQKPYCIDRRTKLPDDVEMKEWLCIGDARVGEGASLERSVIWDDISIGAGCRVSDRIVSNSCSTEW